MVCFFKQKTAYEMRISDWSSDVCSSDLPAPTAAPETGPTLVPRFDTDIASFTQDENKLFKLASENSELVSELAVTLNPETELYVEELLSILERVSQDRWSGERA